MTAEYPASAGGNVYSLALTDSSGRELEAKKVYILESVFVNDKGAEVSRKVQGIYKER